MGAGARAVSCETEVAAGAGPLSEVDLWGSFSAGCWSHTALQYGTSRMRCITWQPSSTVGPLLGARLMKSWRLYALAVVTLLDAIRETLRGPPAVRSASTKPPARSVRQHQPSRRRRKRPPFTRAPLTASPRARLICLTMNYRESYGMFACSGILYNHESPLRGGPFRHPEDHQRSGGHPPQGRADPPEARGPSTSRETGGGRRTRARHVADASARRAGGLHRGEWTEPYPEGVSFRRLWLRRHRRLGGVRRLRRESSPTGRSRRARWRREQGAHRSGLGTYGDLRRDDRQMVEHDLGS